MTKWARVNEVKIFVHSAKGVVGRYSLNDEGFQMKPWWRFLIFLKKWIAKPCSAWGFVDVLDFSISAGLPETPVQFSDLLNTHEFAIWSWMNERKGILRARFSLIDTTLVRVHRRSSLSRCFIRLRPRVHALFSRRVSNGIARKRSKKKGEANTHAAFVIVCLLFSPSIFSCDAI